MFKYRVIFPLLILLMFAQWPASGQIALSREECRQMALDYSRQMMMAQNKQQQARLSRKIARAAYLPALSASGIFFYTPHSPDYSIDGGYLPTYKPDEQGNMQPNVRMNPATGQPVTGPNGEPVIDLYAFLPDIGIEIGMEGVTAAGVVLEQPIYTGGKITAANRMAGIALEMAGTGVELNRAQIITQTDAAYWRYLSTQAKLKAARDYKTLLDSLVTSVSASLNAGMATRNELLKAEVKRNEALLMLQKADNGLKLSAMDLCRITGLPLETPITVNDSLSAEETHTTVMDAGDNVQDRPEFRLLTQKEKLQHQKANEARADLLPRLGVQAAYSYFGGLELNDKGSDSFSFSALASLKIPIFNWMEGQNKLKRARLQQQAAQMEREDAERMMQLEMAQARFNLEDARTRVELTSRSLRQARENLETSREKYNTGLEPLVNLLEAQAQWQQAKSEKIDALTEVKMSETRYLKASGRL